MLLNKVITIDYISISLACFANVCANLLPKNVVELIEQLKI